MEDFSQIPHSASWRTITPIIKGWSNDRKYRVVDADGQQFLLRTNNSEEQHRKFEEFRMMVEFSKTGVYMSSPIDHGLFDNNRRVYTLLSWVEGIEAEEYVKSVSNTQQYKLGFAAGKALRQLHSIQAPPTIADWSIRYNKKIDSKLAIYNEGPVKLQGERYFLDFIEHNRSLINNREQTYQHGDFHIGNLIITPQADIGIIDFNRTDFGDPWEEFNRIIFCAQASGSFATGRIDGYFDSKVPEEFFRLLALYISINAIGAIAWAVPFGESDLATMIKNANSVLDFYDYFNTTIPNWYKNNH